MLKHANRSLILLLLLSACADQSSDTDTPSAHEQVEEVAQVAQAITAVDQPSITFTLNPIADTSVKSSAKNKNYGGQSTIDVNRALVRFKQQDILDKKQNSGDGIASAKLRLTLVPPGLLSLPIRLIRSVDAHRVLKDWTESGATWNCAQDAIPSNSAADCSGATQWAMNGTDAFVSTATGSAILPIFRTGVIEIDVTDDVREWTLDSNAQNFGWLLKTGLDLGENAAMFGSKESGTPPQLVVKMIRCNDTICVDGNDCTADGLCNDDGTCKFPGGAAGGECGDLTDCILERCDNFNVCNTVGPEDEGTMCGTEGVCNATGICSQ